MNFNHIKSLIKRDFCTFRNSKWKWLEVFYFPITSIIIWGLFALWTKELGSLAGKIALTVNIFWSYLFVVQSSADYEVNEDMWGRSGRNVFAAGITHWEYITAHCLFSVIISLPVFFLMLLIAHSIFGINLLFLFPAYTIHLMLFTIFLGITWAIIIAGLLVLLGRELNFITWSFLQLFIMLSFPLIPIENLPKVMQTFAKFMPFTPLFSAARKIAVGITSSLAKGWMIALIYFIFALIFYELAFHFARKTGRLAKAF